jgi:hypothetical protein
LGARQIMMPFLSMFVKGWFRFSFFPAWRTFHAPIPLPVCFF